MQYVVMLSMRAIGRHVVFTCRYVAPCCPGPNVETLTHKLTQTISIYCLSFASTCVLKSQHYDISLPAQFHNLFLVDIVLCNWLVVLSAILWAHATIRSETDYVVSQRFDQHGVSAYFVAI